MSKLNLTNKWILITGASSGLGKELALYLAEKEKANLILAARRKHLLKELQDTISSDYKVEVKIFEVDLNKDKSAEELFLAATEETKVYAIFNNAGITSYEKTDIQQMEIYENIINVNMKSLFKLSLLFLNYFQKIGEGAIINIASVAAFLPIPFQNVYCACKHAVLAFTESLHIENTHKNIHICTFAPGGTATEMITNAGLDHKYKLDSIYYMKAKTVARKAVKSFKKKRYLKVPGAGNKLMVFLPRFFPRRIVARVAGFFYRPPASK